MKSLKKLRDARLRWFWSNHFFTIGEKRKLKETQRYAINTQMIMWWGIPAICVIVNALQVHHAKFACNPEWHLWLRLLYKLTFFFATTGGYYAAVLHEVLFAHAVWHQYFQMIVLSTYMEKEFRNLRNIPFMERFSSVKYQCLAKSLILRSIQQHQRIVRYSTSTGLSERNETCWSEETLRRSGQTVCFLLKTLYFSTHLKLQLFFTRRLLLT